MTMTRARRWVLTGILAALLLAGLTLTSPHGVRVAAAVAGCLLLPGLGWARKMRLSDRGDTIALAVVLSICTTVVVGTTMAVAGAWSTVGGLAALALVTVTGFVPFAALADRSRAATRRRIAAFGDDGGAWEDWFVWSEQQDRLRREQAAAAADQANDVWVDWYADAERRARDEPEQRSAAGADEWVGWYRSQLADTRTETKDDDR